MSTATSELSVDTHDEIHGAAAELSAGHSLVLTVLCHADLSRVGEIFRVEPSEQGLEVSRLTPLFESIDGERVWPLADPFLSRSPFQLVFRSDGTMMLRRPQGAIAIRANDAAVVEDMTFDADEVRRGVVLELGQRVVILAQLQGPSSGRVDQLGLIGESPSMLQLRREILRVGPRDVPVLLRGETGSGKELVANAIHLASRRKGQPFVVVNMGAVAPTLAASELFGHVKGSFTGAADHQGVFERADRGTLFLDEIGETPIDVQPMLLRALEGGSFVPIGAHRTVVTNVRVVSATDANLEQAASEGRFRSPLLYRLGGYQIHVPALRDRLDDLGRLFVHFLEQELEPSERHKIEGSTAFVPAHVMARLARYSWPGNVRQLRNVVRQLVIASHGRSEMVIDVNIDRLLSQGIDMNSEASAEPLSPETPASVSTSPRRKPSDVSKAELISALRANHFVLEPTAAALGISRASLYALIERTPDIRKAKDIPRDEILQLHRELKGDVRAMAEKLEVSSRGLLLRLNEILGGS
ncbi:MAG: sigma-54-dependent Fis family transcriptional regulator [Deltaproteobacteria bacterium]|nr:sigma-54-dependent Fis family transcriptional regulator [Deltaproteobacteria bacterium]